MANRFFNSMLQAPAAGIALVQSASGTTGDGSAGLTVNFGVPVTAANSVLSFISFDNTAENGLNAVTCVGGGAEVLGQEASEDAQLPNIARIYAATSVAGGETGVAYDANDPIRTSNIIAEYSGLADAPAESTATSSATSTTLAIGTITPTSANNLLTAIFAFNADVTAVGIANDVLVTGIGAGVYTPRGTQIDRSYYNLLGEADNPDFYAIAYGTYDIDTGWYLLDGDGNIVNQTGTSAATYPWQASWTGSTVTEIPGWELVGTRTGGSSVWEYVYARVQSTATPSNPTIVLSGSCDIAGAGAAFGGV